MAYARGIELLTVDDRGRIVACRIIKKYLRPEKSFKDKESDESKEEELTCNIGFADDPKLPVLILVNDQFADLYYKESEASGLKKIRAVAGKEELVSEEKSFHRIFRPVEIKTNKIQLSPAERTKLKITNKNRQVIVEGDGERFLIWPLDEYRKRFPTFYGRLDLKDDGNKAP